MSIRICLLGSPAPLSSLNHLPHLPCEIAKAIFFFGVSVVFPQILFDFHPGEKRHINMNFLLWLTSRWPWDNRLVVPGLTGPKSFKEWYTSPKNNATIQELSVLKRCVPKTYAFAFGLRLRVCALKSGSRKRGVGFRAACLQNETALEKLLNRDEKRFEKREKKIRKAIRNVFEKCLAPLRPLKNISPALFNRNFKSFSPPKICAQKIVFFFSPRGSAGVATLTIFGVSVGFPPDSLWLSIAFDRFSVIFNQFQSVLISFNQF